MHWAEMSAGPTDVTDTERELRLRSKRNNWRDSRKNKESLIILFRNETLTHINNLAALSPSAAYNFVSSEKAAMVCLT